MEERQAFIKREALRYLGVRGGEATCEPSMLALLAECMEEAEQAAKRRFVMREHPLAFEEENGRLMVCGVIFRTDSRALGKNLKDCESVLVMAATLGRDADRLLARSGALHVAKAAVFQAVFAAMIEEYCNGLCAGWKTEYEARGRFLRPRFSPGYGDFPLSTQETILNGLEAGKRIGLFLTDGYLMSPVKSVTAVIGVSRRPAPCVPEGCEACKKSDCPYRRAESGAA